MAATVAPDLCLVNWMLQRKLALALFARSAVLPC